MSASPAEGSDEWKAQDKGPIIVIVCWIVTAISTCFVFGRVYVRGKIMKKFQSDDWFIILGLFCGYISTALSTIAVTYGNGRHMSLLSTEQQQGAILWTTAAFCPGIMSFGLPKLAVVSLLVRLMNPDRYHKWFLWWLGIWCQLTLFVTAGLLLGRCMPARSLWDFSVKGTCFDVNILVAYCIYAGSFSAFVDVYLAVYPAIVLFRLQMATKKKIALSCALGIGSISGIVAIYKTTRIPSLASKDFSYDTSDLVIWTVVEGSTIIIASSIPVMQPLLELILRRNPFSSAKGSKQTPQYYEDYGSQSKSKSRGGGGIELGQRKPKIKPKDELGLTIVEGDSQENILTPATDSNQGISASLNAPTLTSRQSDSSQRPSDGKIIRTDFVSVTYEEQGPVRDISASSRWRAV
ncbi:integral membrane protein [Colletotrichum lupini]|nr:integral membrane protein [Colletotrichum lupini]